MVLNKRSQCNCIEKISLVLKTLIWCLIISPTLYHLEIIRSSQGLHHRASCGIENQLLLILWTIARGKALTRPLEKIIRIIITRIDYISQKIDYQR